MSTFTETELLLRVLFPPCHAYGSGNVRVKQLTSSDEICVSEVF